MKGLVGNSMMAGTEMMRIADMGIFEVQVDSRRERYSQAKACTILALVEIRCLQQSANSKSMVTQIASSNTTASSQAASSF